jgi:hypothetical protein
MAGVFELLVRPQKRAVAHCTSRADLKFLELQTAKEILAEVFRVKVSDVEEMIQNRFEAHVEETRCEDDGLWPREFWLEGRGLRPS